MWSLNLLRVESVAATKVKRHSVHALRCGVGRPGRTRSVRWRSCERTLAHGTRNKEAWSCWIAPRTLGRYRTPLASPRPRLPTGSEPPRGRAAGPEPPDRPPRLPASSGTYQRVPRRGFAMRTGSHTPTLEPCTPALAPSNRILSRSLPRGVRRGAPSMRRGDPEE